MVVLLYVDVMIITGNNKDEVVRLQDELCIRFDIKKLGELYHFLGLEVTNMNKQIFVTQKGYAKKLVVRSDIAFSVGYVSRFMQKPRKPHLEAAKRVLKYINSTSDMVLFFKKKNNLVLVGYTDANFGGDLDNRISTSGYIFFYGGTSVSCCSKNQDSISLSTTEAEYKAVVLTAQECVWVQRLAEDLHLPISKLIVIFGDNQSAIKLANNLVFHARTKHIEV
ncbi:secreted RxLR effector protein 161-like [Nicotiana tomentosiformis]|uniref:secreted RxLR effector protein 161-like n=1 Tax=Nicotiana tomentosiformis TaxID=4098 RepID=UPI001447C0E0|nr:secreted RxLR effector protein 161-like [Nicotiana tomentosiformis]